MQVKKVLTSVALAVAAMGAAHAAAFPDFRIDPDMATPATNVLGDKFVGGYSEVATFSPTSPLGGNVAVSLKWEASGMFKDDGVNSVPAGVSRLGVDYGLYALFVGTGTYSTSLTGVTTFNITGGTLQLFRDNDLLTDLTATPANGSTPWAVGGSNLDDVLLGSGTLISGFGTLDPTLPTCNNSGNINCGSFGQSNTFALTDDGKKFFVDPIPFYSLAFESGQLNNFTPTATQVINGSLDVVFAQVPEPTSLALAGLALLGLGAARRRRG